MSSNESSTILLSWHSSNSRTSRCRRMHYLLNIMSINQKRQQWKYVKKFLWIGGVSLLVLFLFYTYFPAYAQDLSSGVNEVGQASGLGGGDIRLVIAQIIRVILGILGVIAI